MISFFFVFSVVSFFIVCMKQFKFQNARCFCCCCWFPVDVPPFFVVTFFLSVFVTFSLLCSYCVHLILYIYGVPHGRLHYYYYCSVCVCVSVLCLHQLMTFYVWGFFFLSCARRCWTAFGFLFFKKLHKKTLCKELRRVCRATFSRVISFKGGVIGSVYCCTVWEMENNWCLFFSVFPLSSLTYLPCSETSIISSNDVRTILSNWCHFVFLRVNHRPFFIFCKSHQNTGIKKWKVKKINLGFLQFRLID